MTLVADQPALLCRDVLAALEPIPEVRTWDWIQEHGRMPDGQPFDGDRIPWFEGVCDAYDDPVTRTLSLMWGTRLGKTAGSLQVTACNMATRPMPGLFSTSTQQLVKRTVSNKIYPVLEAVEATAEQLPPEHLRSWERIALAHSTWAVAWSGSATMLADLDAFYGHANEIDKWSYNEQLGGEAGEGDALVQFEERFKEYPDHKIIFECSPTTKTRSRIYKKLQASNNCRYWVPCPSCRRRQVLSFPNLIWDKNPDGSHDIELARTTARYVCEHCRKEIYDEQRFEMMRGGKWAPEGCRVDRRGRVIGTPKRSPRHWGGQLSSLYSLQMQWGAIAAKFVASKDSPRLLQMFVNGWLADVWEPFRSKSEPEDVGERLSTEVEPGTIPDWATWLFAGADVQEECLVFVVLAVGPDERVAVVERGICDTWEELEKDCITRKFPHADGGESLCSALALIDCGHRTKEVYDFCQKFKGTGHLVMPCKGANTDCNGEPYQKINVGEGTKAGSKTMKRLALAARGLIRVRVNPFHYEPIIQKQLDKLSPGEDGSLSLPAGSQDDLNFLRQICNAALSPEPSKADPSKHLWVKRWEGEENDYRDCIKYARCAADVKFRGNWSRAKRRQTAASGGIPRQDAAPRNATESTETRTRSMRGRIPRRRIARRRG